MQRIAIFVVATGLAFSVQSGSGGEEPPPLGSAAISTGRSDVVVKADSTSPGRPDETNPSNLRSESSEDSSAAPPPSRPTLTECLVAWDSYNRCFRSREAAAPETPQQPAPAPGRAITVTDLARFAPPPVPITTEPFSAGIAGMPLNFTSAASAHTVSGSLFGRALTVRFTPAGYDYDYDDGTTATTASPGLSWAALGQAQFTPTPTSHVYSERGTYTVALSTRYTADIDLGSGWIPVDGELTLTSPPTTITVYEAHTALVAHTCTERPTAPGC